MGTFADLPRGARRLIVCTVALGVAVLGWHTADLGSWNRWDLLTWFGLTVAAALAEQFTVEIRHRTENENFSLTDAIWVPALLLARPSVLTLAVFAGTILGQAARRWSFYKVAYNTAQFLVAITAAQLVYAAFGSPSKLGLTAWLAGAVGMLAYFLLNEVFIAGVISMVESEQFRKVLVLPAGLNVLHAAGNVTIGMLVALVWSFGPSALPLLITPIVLSYLAYRGWIHAQQEEQQAAERERMQALYEAGRALFGPLEVKFDFRPFLQLVRRMVDAAGVELVMLDGDQARVYNSESGLSVTTTLTEDAPEPEALLSTRPNLSRYVAPISGDQVRGVLAVHRQEALSNAEGSLVQALASQVYVRQENQRLFQETAQQRSHLADVIGNTSDGIFVVAADRRILSWNPAMERITGFSRSEVVDRHWDDVLQIRFEREGGELSEPNAGNLLESIDSQDALVLRRDGKGRWIRCASNPMPSQNGDARAYVVMARDVTAELEAERMKSDFVATVSHELRTPLTPLKGFLTSLEQGLVEDSPESRREYYGIMRRQAERLERLINDILDVSRIEAGSLKMETKAMELVLAVGEDIEEAKRQPRARQVEFVHPDGNVWVGADSFRVGQVMSNLLSNAFKYSPADTTVQVRIGMDEGRAAVSVHNEGEGISPADQQRVFDRFYRSDDAVASRAGGVGLGLYIARRLAEAMGGNLLLESTYGNGCTFSFTLPLLDASASSVRETGHHDVGEGSTPWFVRTSA